MTYFLLMYGARRATRLAIPRPLTGTISANSILVRLEVRRLKWLFPPFVRTKIPDPVKRKRFEVALWVLILYLPVVCLRGTLKTPLTQNSAGPFHPRMIGQSILTQKTLNELFLFGLGRSQYHQHTAPLETRCLFYLGDI